MLSLVSPSGLEVTIPVMLLIVAKADGTEEAYEVPETTKLRTTLHEGYWFFRTISGGEVALAETVVFEMKLGNVQLVGQHND